MEAAFGTSVVRLLHTPGVMVCGDCCFEVVAGDHGVEMCELPSRPVSSTKT